MLSHEKHMTIPTNTQRGTVMTGRNVRLIDDPRRDDKAQGVLFSLLTKTRISGGAHHDTPSACIKCIAMYTLGTT